MRPGPALLGGAVVLLLGGCAGGTPQAAPPTAEAPDFSSLPACAEQPSPPELPDVAGLTLPDTALVFSVHDVGTLTQAQGVVELTPLQVRAFYEQHPDLEVLVAEDERVEAEILVTDGRHRMFVKAQIACATGSNLTATVGSESEAEALPRPAGQATEP